MYIFMMDFEDLSTFTPSMLTICMCIIFHAKIIYIEVI